jgi:predicted chitinase
MRNFNNLKGSPIFEENIQDFLKFLDQQKKIASEKSGIGAEILDLLFKGVKAGQQNWDKKETEEVQGGLTAIQNEISPVKGNVQIDGLSGTQKKNAEVVVAALNKYGIVNPLTQKAILSVIGKESGFVPQDEISYANTSNDRIRMIFGKRVSGLSDSELTSLKRDENAFWDKVYGGRYGNDKKGDGSKYRGRGFNGLTFKSNYKKYNRLLQENGVRVDIVSNPDRLNDIDVAAEVNALYFLNGLTNKASKRKFGNDDPNDFTSFDKALGAAVNANAGWGKDVIGSRDYRAAQTYASKFDIGDIESMA